MEGKNSMQENVAALNSLLADIERELTDNGSAGENELALLGELRQQCELNLALLSRICGLEPPR